MINVGQMVRTIRLQVKDTGKIRFSDAEIIDAINVALEALYSAALRFDARAIQKEAVIDIKDGSGQLPYDFGSVVSVWVGTEPTDGCKLYPSTGSSFNSQDKYDIIGMTIRVSSDETSVLLRYCASPSFIQDVDGGIPLPFFMGPYIWGMAVAALLGETDMKGAADKAAGVLSASAFDFIAETAGHV